MRRILFITILIALVISLLIGCATTPTSGTTTGTTSGTTAGTTAGTTSGSTSGATPEPGPYFKFDPAITITAVVSDSSASYGGAFTMEENAWIDLYKDRYGVNLEYLWVVDSAQYSEKINLMLTGGDLPDFFNANAVQFQQAYEFEQIQEVDEVFEIYTSQSTKDLMMEAGMMPFEACKRDGKLWAIPWTTLAHENLYVLYVREDWMNKFGIESVDTFADFEKLLETFATEKPGDVSWVIPEDQNLGMMYSLAPMFSCFPNHWVEMPDGTLQYGALQPEMKATLEKYAEWYKKGYINSEFVTTTGTKRNELIAAGNVGVSTGPFSSPLSWQPTKNNDPELELAYFELPTVSGEPYIFPAIGVGVAGYYLTSKNCEHPEAFPLILNSFMDIFYLSTDPDEGKTYINWEDGTGIWQAAFAKAYRHYKNYQQSIDVQKYLKGEMSFDDLTADSKNVANRIDQFLEGDNATWGWHEIYGPGGIFDQVGKVIEDGRFHENKFFGPTPTSMTQYQAIIDKLQLETFTEIILGNKSISEFDAFVTQWYDLGGKEITDDVNEWKKAR